MSETHFDILPGILLALMIAGLHYKYGLLWLGGERGIARYWSQWAGAPAIQIVSKILLVAAFMLALTAPFVTPSWSVFLVSLALFAAHAILFVMVSR